MNRVGLNRDNLDKFYTKLSVVKRCTELVKEYINISDNDIVIEPSAGNGAFIPYILNMSSTYIFYDIEPEHESIIKQDFLELVPSYNQYNITNERIHIIGNPPFGRQSSLAIKFIKKSASFCDTISFILPKSFKKNSTKKHFPLNFHLLCEIDLDSNSFLVNDNEHDVPCIFQIWEKKQYNRDTEIDLVPINFEFVKIADNPDISFRRVGINAGNIDTNTVDKSVQTHYFIKFHVELTDELLKLLRDIKFGCKDYTVGPKSISKQELIKEFNIYTV